jgi:hypothetical protein
MSIKLRIAVRRNNVRQAIAALRVVPNPATEPEDDLTPAGASLHERLDRIQLRSATLRWLVDELAPRGWQATQRWRRWCGVSDGVCPLVRLGFHDYEGHGLQS